jgi:hypothetical protein
VGETFTILHALANGLSGEFSALECGGTVGSATSVDIGDGLALDASYNDTAGTIVLTVVAASGSSEVPAQHAISPENLADVAVEDGFDFSTVIMSALGGVDSVTKVSSAAALDLPLEMLLLDSHHSLTYTATAGTHAGVTYLVVDPSGVTGYHTGETMIVALTSQEASVFGHLG